MNVVRRDKWKRLGDLEPGLRFRRKDGNGETIRQVSPSPPKFGKEVMCNRDDTGEHCAWPSNELVELVPGRWAPDEPEGLVEIRNVEAFAVVEYEGRFWQLRSARCRLYALENAGQKTLDGSALVRVVHCTLVEDYKEPQDD